MTDGKCLSDSWGCAKVWEDLLGALEVLAPRYFGNLPCGFNYVTELKFSVWNKSVLQHLGVQAVTCFPSLCHLLRLFMHECFPHMDSRSFLIALMLPPIINALGSVNNEAFC